MKSRRTRLQMHKHWISRHQQLKSKTKKMISIKSKEMNKKGIVFTILAITLLSLFLVSYSVYSYAHSREGVDKRIKTLNSFVNSLEQDVPRKVYVSGYRIIFLFGEHIIKTGSYITDFNNTFADAFFNGSIYGEDYKIDNGGLMQGATFSDIVEEINNKAKGMNINVSFVNPRIIVTQEDPWNVKVTLESDLYIKDLGGLASWNKTSYPSVYIPIKNFEDPIYIKNTYAKIVNKFIQTNYSLPITGSNLTLHADNSYYINHTDAPSFLKRLSGDFSADPNGIESIVNLHELSSQGISTPDKCVLDYVYFDPNNNPEITATYDWIKLCGNHAGIYG